MRELKEEELAKVYGGTAGVQNLRTDFLPAPGQYLVTPERLLRHEYSALSKLRGHTLMDQMNVDS